MIRVLNGSPRQALIMVVTVHHRTWNGFAAWDDEASPSPCAEAGGGAKVNEPGAATFAIRMQYRGKE